VDELTRLALAAARGDAAATAAFVRAGQADVWRLCAQLGRPADPDDLTQETLVRALRGLRHFRAESSARTWLLAIARRVCADSIRAARRRSRAHERAAAEPDDAIVADDTTGSAVRQLVAALDDHRREAFVLTQVLGLSYAEAAEVCRCPVGTIRSRVARARDDLVRALHADTAAEA
jgi:RNA polymerase sigma-70 factor, ECF subfamily